MQIMNTNRKMNTNKTFLFNTSHAVLIFNRYSVYVRNLQTPYCLEQSYTDLCKDCRSCFPLKTSLQLFFACGGTCGTWYCLFYYLASKPIQKMDPQIIPH